MGTESIIQQLLCQLTNPILQTAKMSSKSRKGPEMDIPVYFHPYQPCFPQVSCLHCQKRVVQYCESNS